MIKRTLLILCDQYYINFTTLYGFLVYYAKIPPPPKLMEWMYTATNVSLWNVAFKTKDTGYLYMFMRKHLKKFYEIAYLDLNDWLNILSDVLLKNLPLPLETTQKA